MSHKIRWWCCPPALPRPAGCFLCFPIRPWPICTCPRFFRPLCLAVGCAHRRARVSRLGRWRGVARAERAQYDSVRLLVGSALATIWSAAPLPAPKRPKRRRWERRVLAAGAVAPRPRPAPRARTTPLPGHASVCVGGQAHRVCTHHPGRRPRGSAGARSMRQRIMAELGLCFVGQLCAA